MVDGVYEDFTGIVAKGRKLSISRVKEIAEGRVYSGVQALEIGLIDGFGGLDYSIQSAARKAKLKRYRVREFPTEKDPFEQLFAALEMKALIRSSVRENPLGSSLIKSAEHVSQLSGIQMRVPWSTEYR
jgi:protease-4